LKAVQVTSVSPGGKIALCLKLLKDKLNSLLLLTTKLNYPKQDPLHSKTIAVGLKIKSDRS
jgi:hypothetical protein